ncbi:terminal uridylyltransferase Tailor [Aphomia sociella]
MELEDDILNTSLLNLRGDFNAQVNYILKNVRLSRAEVENLRCLFSDLEQSLQKAWPGCRVWPFGSIVTGLGIKTSDADCYVWIPEHLRNEGDKYVTHARRILIKRPTNFTDLFAITAAKVPIVKCFHVPTRCHCDVSFKSESGVRNSNLLGTLLHSDSRALPLAVLIKYWSKVHGLTGTNLLPNYTLVIMVIFYLQQVNILPSIFQIQNNAEIIMVDDWDNGFNEDFNFESTNNMSLYKLLGGFFEYYSNFDFNENIVCPYLGQPLSKKLFKSLQTVPSQLELYKHNVTNKVCKPLYLKGSMCVQDPFDHSRNASVAVYSKLAEKFFCHLKFVAKQYKECSENNFFNAILLSKLNVPQPKLAISNEINNVEANAPNKIRKRNKKNKNVHNSFQDLFIEINRLMKNNRR